MAQQQKRFADQVGILWITSSGMLSEYKVDAMLRLRHKPGSAVTRQYYIKPITSDVLSAMETLEKSVAGSPLVPQVPNLPTLIH